MRVYVVVRQPQDEEIACMTSYAYLDEEKAYDKASELLELEDGCDYFVEDVEVK